MPFVKEPFHPGSVIPMARAPRPVSGLLSRSATPEMAADRPTPNAAPPPPATGGRTWDPGVLTLSGDRATSPAGPKAPKHETTAARGLGVNVRAAIVAHQAPPTPTAPVKLPPLPVRGGDLYAPGGVGKGGALAETDPGERIKPPKTGTWSKKGAGAHQVPIPFYGLGAARKGGVPGTPIAARADGPLPAWAPGASAGRAGVPGEKKTAAPIIGRPSMLGGKK